MFDYHLDWLKKNWKFQDTPIHFCLAGWANSTTSQICLSVLTNLGFFQPCSLGIIRVITDTKVVPQRLQKDSFKCIVPLGTDVNQKFTHTIPQKYQRQFVPIERRDTVRDLRVIFDEKLNFKEHNYCQINMAYKMVQVIKRNFKYLNIQLCFSV